MILAMVILIGFAWLLVDFIRGGFEEARKENEKNSKNDEEGNIGEGA